MNRQEALETLGKFDEHLKNRIADEQRGGNPAHEATARRVLKALRYVVGEVKRLSAENAELVERAAQHQAEANAARELWSNEAANLAEIRAKPKPGAGT